jgi:hypothetical protein
MRLRGLVVTAMACAQFAACVPAEAPATSSPTTSPTPTPTASATASPTTVPATPSPSPAAACPAAQLVARITQWEGAAGHRVATVELANNGTSPCSVAALDKPQLVDGVDKVLIEGTEPTSVTQVAIAAGGTLHTLVQDGNYCGAAPIVPVTLAFVLPGGAGRIVAAPLTPEDSTGVPPCNGPGGPGDIQMQPWAP